MTYRDAIQNQIALIDKIYDNAGSIRDFANDQEKDIWNEIRKQTRLLLYGLQRLDNQMSDKRAQEQLKGEY